MAEAYLGENLPTFSLSNVDGDGDFTDDQRESRISRCKAPWKELTIIVIFCAAFSVIAFPTYIITRSHDVHKFKTEYKNLAQKVEEAIKTSMKEKLNTANALASMYTSLYGQDDIWSNVTISDFPNVAVEQIRTGEVIAISYSPIINGIEEQREFETYATKLSNISGVEQLRERSCDTCRFGSDGNFRKVNGTLMENHTSLSTESKHPEVKVPVWQILPKTINWKDAIFDLQSEISCRRALDDMLEYQVPTITAILHPVEDHGDSRYYLSSMLFYPVFDRFAQNMNKENSSYISSEVRQQHLQRRIKGSIGIKFPWVFMFRDILPFSIKGMIVVLESSASSSNSTSQQLWTYEINGKDAILIGDGDLHNGYYDKFEHIVKVNVVRDAIMSSGTNTDADTDTDTDNDNDIGIVDETNLVKYELRIFPSSRFQNYYMSTRPIGMTFVVTSLFILVVWIVMLFDVIVRQHSTTRRRLRAVFPELNEV